MPDALALSARQAQIHVLAQATGGRNTRAGESNSMRSDRAQWRGAESLV